MDPKQIVPNPASVVPPGSTGEPEPTETPRSEPEIPAANLVEIKRLQVELYGTDDALVQAAIEGRLAQLGARPNPIPEPSEPEEELPSPPSTAAMQQAERLIREARVEKMRGSAQKALELVKSAAEIAPGSAIVQEALGDDLAERSRLGEARRAYRLAVRLDPSNVGVERKYAAIVAKASGIGSIDDQLRAALSDSLLPDASDSLASGPVAVLFSAIVPGLGQLVTGKKGLGIGLLSVWMICVVWLSVMHDDVPRLFINGGEGANRLVIAPAVIMMITWLTAVGTMTTGVRSRARKSIDRPLPPVDMKFD
jgi:TM2 domain-containing membrane protein YozV